MPTVLQKEGFAVRIYTRDHPPPHVHVVKADEVIIINLGSATEPVTIREARMQRTAARRAVEIVEECRLFLLEKWSEIYE